MSRSRLTGVALALALAVPSTGEAYSGGIDTFDCTGCHGGGETPMVRVTSTPADPAPGTTARLRVAIEAINGGPGGFHLAATGAGTLREVAGQGTRMHGERVVTHRAPRASSDGWITFEVDLVLSGEPGDVQLAVSGVSANGDGRPRGDAAATTNASVVFGCEGQTLYGDLDGDGYGAEARGTIEACEPRAGWSTRGDDCDDNSRDAYPGATEVCNRRDDDCDGIVDEGVDAVLLYPDNDGDGYGGRFGDPVMGCDRPGYGIGNEDCDDNDPNVHPGATEVCGGYDEDCDGRIDEGVRPLCGVGMCQRTSLSCDLRDCYPGDPAVELCNAWDDDCDGTVDEGSGLCPGGQRCEAGYCVGEVGDGGNPVDGEGSGGCSASRAPSSPLLVALGLGLGGLAWRRRSPRRRRG